MIDSNTASSTSRIDSLISKERSLQYWENVDASDNGMLGGVPAVAGFSHTSKVDLQGSRSFLAKLGIGMTNDRRIVAHALEGGAGIGRVTDGLLRGLALHIDVIEPVIKFNDKLRGNSGVRHIFNVGLEGWLPLEAVRYDLIWIQWCVGYLTDEQLLGFLKQCGQALNPENGVIVLKENISMSGSDLFDATDSGLIREDSKFRQLFTQAGLRITKTDLQKGLPRVSSRKLLPVRMYALKPMVDVKPTTE
ncbi:hypothetical protein PG990_013106 [Apiospora arundinis]